MNIPTARLGSRFCIVWDAERKQVKHSGAGAPYARVAGLKIGLESNGGSACFPFEEQGPHFDSVEQELTATSVTWRGFWAEAGLQLDLRITAPFCPEDRTVSCLPALFLDLKVSQPRDLLRQHWFSAGNDENRKGGRKGRLRVALDRDGVATVQTPRAGEWQFCYEENLREIDAEWNPPHHVERAPESAEITEAIRSLEGAGECQGNGLIFDYDLDAGQDHVSLVWASHTADRFMAAPDGASVLACTAEFPDLDAVLSVAETQRDELVAKSRAFDQRISGARLGVAYERLFSLGFQWYLANTWWLRKDSGKEWFTVTEGKCLFLSTVDVEYNIAPFYLEFWPELLRLQLEQWTAYVTEEGFLHHDIGKLPTCGECAYPHPMPCEESANWLLMLLGYWHKTGDAAFVRQHADTLQTLCRYLLAADTTGNGMPDQGTANTIDDASDAVQFAAENVYIAVKTYAAIVAARTLDRECLSGELMAACQAHEQRFIETMETRAWLGDHYAVCLPSEHEAERFVHEDEVHDGGDGRIAVAAPLYGAQDAAYNAAATGVAAATTCPGWDAASLHTANGLYYLLYAGVPHGLNPERLRQDIQTSYERSVDTYGCWHSSADRSNLWISQNLWRDAIAGMLGLDFTAEVQRYLAFEEFANSQGLSRGFVDTYGWNNLHSYPRGLTAAALLVGKHGRNRQ